MSDPVTRQAEEWLRNIKREFRIAFHKHGRAEIPVLRVQISDHPPNASSDLNLRQLACSRPVFAELQRLVLDPLALRVYFDNGDRHPWFDLVSVGDQGSLTFHIAVLHPAAELKSSA